MAGGIRDVAADYANVDDPALALAAEGDRLPLHEVLLAVDAHCHDQAAGGNRSPDVGGQGAAIAQLLPGHRLAGRLVGQAAGVVEEGLLGGGIALGLQPGAGDPGPALQGRVGAPDPEAAMIGLGLGVLRAPLQAALHGLQLVLADLGAAADAGEVRIVGILLDGGQHVGPLEHLHPAALGVGAGHEGQLLAAGLEALGDAAARVHQRRRDLQDLGELVGLGAAVGLGLRIAGGVHLPLGQVVLALALDGDLRQRRWRVGAGDQKGAAAVGALLVVDAVGRVAAPLREQPRQGRRGPEHRLQLHPRPAGGVVVGRVGVEEVARILVQRAQGEDVGDRGLAELGRAAQGDVAAGVLRAQRRQDLVELRERLAAVGAREGALPLREDDVVLGPG